MGDGADDAAEGGVALLVFTEGVFQDSSLEVLRDGWTLHEQKCIRDWFVLFAERTELGRRSVRRSVCRDS